MKKPAVSVKLTDVSKAYAAFYWNWPRVGPSMPKIDVFEEVKMTDPNASVEVPNMMKILCESLDAFDYPSSQIAETGGIGQNTFYDYVSNSFLDGLVNYANIQKAFIVGGDDLDRARYRTHEELVASLNSQVHSKLNCGQDVILLGNTDKSFWLFWYDQDCSNCALLRIERSFFQDFEQFVSSVLGFVKESEHGRGSKPTLFEFEPKGWIAF